MLMLQNNFKPKLNNHPSLDYYQPINLFLAGRKRQSE